MKNKLITKALERFEREFPKASPRAGEGLGVSAGMGMIMQYKEDKLRFRSFLEKELRTIVDKTLDKIPLDTKYGELTAYYKIKETINKLRL